MDNNQMMNQSPPSEQIKPTSVKHSKLDMMLPGFIVLITGLVIGLAAGYFAFNSSESEADKIAEEVIIPELGEDYRSELSDIIDNRGLLESNSQEINATYEAINRRARDTERKTDINAMHTQLEVYYADNGFYPLPSVYDTTIIAAQTFPGLSEDALLDPDGNIINASDSDYSVDLAGCDSQGCQSYTITASLEEADDYTKNSLNQ